jgi:UDP-hydrolysing UDP-N-acetyl-D-glucosamine 2-epimerase
LRPDLVLVMGDRLDMLPAAAATLPANLPLAHLHGGELTEGAIDDRIRHALTKLAHLHLVSCGSAKARVRAFGEEPWRIVETGAPGLDTLLAAPDMTRADFLHAVGLAAITGATKGFRLVTVHPETNAPAPLAPLQAVLAALDRHPMPTLITAPNSDPGGAAMKEMIAGFVGLRPWALSVDTLGPRLYPSALRHASLMLGNSSSGIVEAGLFGLPVIDVGGRQRGRERGRNVRHVASDAAAIRVAEAAILANPERIIDCPYGDGKAGPRVAEAMLAFHDRPLAQRMSKRLESQ